MKKGFTLIELLVVIAIIGILATIVIVNVNTARNKANDVAIKAAIEQTRSVAELIYDSGSASYAALCETVGNTLNGAEPTYGTQLTAAKTGISNNGGSEEKCYADSASYCVSAKLKSGTIQCVDSDGRVNSTACDTTAGTPFTCQ